MLRTAWEKKYKNKGEGSRARATGGREVGQQAAHRNFAGSLVGGGRLEERRNSNEHGGHPIIQTHEKRRVANVQNAWTGDERHDELGRPIRKRKRGGTNGRLWGQGCQQS